MQEQIMTKFPPRLIGLCGHPKSGKSEVQRILAEEYGIIPVDDGFVLRKFAVDNLGLTWDDVMTQEGKANYTRILGRDWQNRDILGTLGKKLEDMFGEHIMPMIAVNACDPDGFYSFGSVRKTQGHYYNQRGGVVIEVIRPGALPSGYDFDKYDQSAVKRTILNDGSLEDLRVEVIRTIESL